MPQKKQCGVCGVCVGCYFVRCVRQKHQRGLALIVADGSTAHQVGDTENHVEILKPSNERARETQRPFARAIGNHSSKTNQKTRDTCMSVLGRTEVTSSQVPTQRISGHAKRQSVTKQWVFPNDNKRPWTGEACHGRCLQGVGEIAIAHLEASVSGCTVKHPFARVAAAVEHFATVVDTAAGAAGVADVRTEVVAGDTEAEFVD